MAPPLRGSARPFWKPSLTIRTALSCYPAHSWTTQCRADNTPPFEMQIMEIPASSHPHGIRPGGEGGTTPALGLLINAIVDALKEFGVKDIAMPATPERVWRAIQEAKD